MEKRVLTGEEGPEKKPVQKVLTGKKFRAVTRSLKEKGDPAPVFRPRSLRNEEKESTGILFGKGWPKGGGKRTDRIKPRPSRRLSWWEKKKFVSSRPDAGGGNRKAVLGGKYNGRE